jgi:hypothetical protein
MEKTAENLEEIIDTADKYVPLLIEMVLKSFINE